MSQKPSGTPAPNNGPAFTASPIGEPLRDDPTDGSPDPAAGTGADGSPDPAADKTTDGSPDPAADADGTDDGNDGGEGNDDGDQEANLDDGAKAVIRKERQAAKDAEKRAKAAERERDRLKAQLEGKGDKNSNGDKDADKANERDAVAKANQRIVRAELKAEAKGKLADPTDALAFIDLDQFEVNDDGEVDADALSEAIEDLLERKPHLAAGKQKRFNGSADGGARKPAAPGQLTAADLDRMTPEQINEARKAGRLNKLMGITA